MTEQCNLRTGDAGCGEVKYGFRVGRRLVLRPGLVAILPAAHSCGLTIRVGWDTSRQTRELTAKLMDRDL